MAGSISLSLSQQFDNLGRPLSGGLLYFFAANTTTPQNAYSDTGLTNALANPITLDASGRVPEFYLADGNIHVRLTDSTGSVLVDAQNVLVVGPSSGSGGGGTSVDPTAIFQTGDVMWIDVTGTRSGWVRDNGRTIGSATSGGSERANSDCQNLYTYIWNAFGDTICPVSGGRGISAAADWAANKPIATPDKRGYAPCGLTDMGNTNTAAYSGVPIILGNSQTGGGKLGEVLHQLTTAELASHTHNYVRTQTGNEINTQTDNLAAGGTPVIVFSTTPGSVTVSSSASGGDTSHNNSGLRVFGTYYRKL